MSSLLDAALGYAERGWAVFPLAPGSKQPATPRHSVSMCDRTDPWCRMGHAGWEQRATTDADRIRRCWTSGEFGIGIACGPSGLLVVDLDVPKPGEQPTGRWARDGAKCGWESLALLAHDHGHKVPDTYAVNTVSQGQHLYFRHPSGPAEQELRNTVGGLGWLIDTRGHGGYVVGPPTRVDGRCYEVADGRDPAPLPDWITQRLTRTWAAPQTPQQSGGTAVPVDRVDGYVRAAVGGETRKVRDAVQGRRNHTLFCAAVALGQLVAGGALLEADAYAALLDAASTHAAGGFTHAEADATIRSGLSRGAREPRNPKPKSHPRSAA